MAYLCPICRNVLLWGGSASYQTLSEHVSNPNAQSHNRSFYYCGNLKCVASFPSESNKRKVIIEKSRKIVDPDSVAMFWDRDGALYGCPWDVKFIDDNNAPFGSFERRLNVTVSKKDENYTLLNKFGFELRVEYSYDANDDGIITERKRHFRLYKRSGHYITKVYSPFRHLRRFKRHRDSFIRNKSAYAALELNNVFRPKGNAGFWEKATSFYVRVFYPILNMKVKNKNRKA